MSEILKEGRVRFRPPRDEKVTAGDQATIDAHHSAKLVLEMLESCYYSTFRALTDTPS